MRKILLLGCLLLGCEGWSATMGPPGIQGPPGGLGGSDGLRLVRRMFVGGDGSAGVLGWRDTKLGHVCRFVEIFGGTEAVCAPPEVQTTNVYADDACTIPLVQSSRSPLQKWWTDARAIGVYQLAQDAIAGTPTWTWADEFCAPSLPCEMGDCSALLPASTLITVDIVDGEGDEP